MKLTPIASNQTELLRPNGTVVFYSYRTPVAAFLPGSGALVTTQKFSRTTSRHITQFLNRWRGHRVDVPQSTIDAIAAGQVSGITG